MRMKCPILFGFPTVDFFRDFIQRMIFNAHDGAAAAVQRPWGAYSVLHVDVGFLVKLIVVAPGARLSLQYHNGRAEHWIVVQGEALATLDGQDCRLAAGDRFYIPVRAMHRLCNPGPAPLRVIEVQMGGWLAEEDIVRLDDDYGRIPATAPSALLCRHAAAGQDAQAHGSHDDDPADERRHGGNFADADPRPNRIEHHVKEGDETKRGGGDLARRAGEQDQRDCQLHRPHRHLGHHPEC